jgi:hypothetical protein
MDSLLLSLLMTPNLLNLKTARTAHSACPVTSWHKNGIFVLLNTAIIAIALDGAP